MKVVYNGCYGGFTLSEEAVKYMAENGSESAKEALAKAGEWGIYYHPERDDPLLVEAVETLGSKVASGSYAALQIAEIPDGADWEIDEYDGNESVVPPRMSW